MEVPLKRNDCKLEVLHNIWKENGDSFTEEHSIIHVNIQPSVQALPEHGKPEGAGMSAALMDYVNGGDK